jgi:hypothetical protein
VTSVVSPAPAAPANFAKRGLHVLAIMLVFVLIGPPVGAFIFMLAIAAANMTNPDLAGLSWVAIFALLYGVPLSYLFGTLPAAAAGLLIGVWQCFIRRSSWMVALGVGLIVGLGFLYAIGRSPPDVASKEVEFWAYPPIFILTCVVPTNAVLADCAQPVSIQLRGGVRMTGARAPRC